MIEQTGHGSDVRGGYVIGRVVKSEKKMSEEQSQTEMDQATLALIADTMSAFGSNEKA